MPDKQMTPEEVVAVCETVIKADDQPCEGRCGAGSVCSACEVKDVANYAAPELARALKAAVEYGIRYDKEPLLDAICEEMSK